MPEPLGTAPDADPAQSLTTRVAHGAAWIMGAGLFARLIGAVNTVIIARLLVPEDIGIVATATITMQLLQGISDIGVSQAVVKFRDATRDDLNTLFTFSFIRGVAIGALLFAAAPFAGKFYGDDRLLWAFIGVAVFPVALGLVNPKYYEFERDLRFSREFIATIANRLSGVGVSLTIAIIFRTYWAIILGMLASAFVQMGLSYVMRPYAPRFSFKSFSRLIGFSGWLGGVSFMAALNNKLDVPILSRAIGQGGAGVYFLGLQLSEMVAGQFSMPLTRAIFPGLAQMQGDAGRMRRAFLRGVEALGAFAMPAAFGLAFVAGDFTSVVLGEKWSMTAPAITYIAPVIGLQSLFFATQSYAVALGLTRLVFIRELVFFSIRTPVFVWAVLTYGLQGAIIAVAATGLFHVILNLALYARASGEPFWEPLLAARRPLGAVAAMALWFVFLRPQLGGPAGLEPLYRLAADVASGAGVYAVALYALWRIEGRPGGVEQDVKNALVSMRDRIAQN